MSFQDVARIVGDTPHMKPEQAVRIDAFLREQKIRDILELGFAHGVSTCFMANALKEMGGGHITTIDLLGARERKPNIEQLLTQCNVRDLVTIFYEPTSYTWRLMKMLEENPAPRFDFCYIDGAHNWFVDGLAFFLADRLLKPGGWILFDDLEWTYVDGFPLDKTDWVQKMPKEERECQQVRKVFDLLVKTHPGYGEFKVDGDWGYARKLATTAEGPVQIRTEVVYVDRWNEMVDRVFRKIRRLLHG